MNTIYRRSIRGARTLALAIICLLLFMAGISYSAVVDVYLRADTFTVPGTAATPGVFGNQAPVTMWAFANCGTDTTFSACTATIPGPAISATEGDTLNIHVRNSLTGLYVEPTSVIIPGQTPSLTPGTWPTWTDGTTGPRTDLAQRVRSFTVETPADNATEVVYTWPNVKAGTYLYQSGTHPAVQVQMGLYGALRVYSVAPVAPATSGQAYADPSTAFNSEVMSVVQ